MPGMLDDSFAGSVVYLCEHSDQGALGLVINKPSDIKLKNLFDKVELPLRPRGAGRTAGVPGRPGADRTRLRAARQAGRRCASRYASTMTMPGGLEMTTCKDVLEALSSGGGPASACWSRSATPPGARVSSKTNWPKQLAHRRRRPGGDLRHADRTALRAGAVAAGPRPADAVAGGGACMSRCRARALPAFLAFDFGLQRTGVAVGNRCCVRPRRRQRSRPRASRVWPPSTPWSANGSPRRWWSACPSTPTAPSTTTPGARGASPASCTARFRLPVYEVDERYSTTEALADGAPMPMPRRPR